MEIIYKVEGMSCSHCVMAVQKNLSKLNLKKFEVNIGFVKVEYDENLIQENIIRKSIEDAGYKVIT